MNEWKFKVGDLVGDKLNKYVIAEIDQVKNGYWISFGGKVYFISKGLMETECELVKPKTLFEQALSLIGLEVGDEIIFIFNGHYSSKFKVTKNGFESLEDGKFVKHFLMIDDALKNPDKIIKLKPFQQGLKSEAEFI